MNKTQSWRIIDNAAHEIGMMPKGETYYACSKRFNDMGDEQRSDLLDLIADVAECCYKGDCRMKCCDTTREAKVAEIVRIKDAILHPARFIVLAKGRSCGHKHRSFHAAMRCYNRLDVASNVMMAPIPEQNKAIPVGVIDFMLRKREPMVNVAAIIGRI